MLDAFRQVVREEIATALKAAPNGNGAAEKDWLRADEAAQLYGLPKTWFEERWRAGEIARTKPWTLRLIFAPGCQRLPGAQQRHRLAETKKKKGFDFFWQWNYIM